MAILQLDRLVLFSLFLQFILLFIAPYRKRVYNLSAPVIWVAYLFAIFVANFSISLIPKNTVEGGRTGNLRAFWAPFLILHLGGPDTITALSLYDNEFWLRYASHFVTLSFAFGRVFLRYSFHKDHLWLPTALMFFAGAVKYVEKLTCLFRARLTKFRESISPDPNPGENYSLLMDAFKSYQQNGLPVQFQQMTATAMAGEQAGSNPRLGENLSHVQIVKKAYLLFQTFRGLFVNFSCSSEQLSESKQLFLSINAEDAFRICEVELNFAYDVFYTKSILIHSGKWQYIRHVALLCQLASLVLWIIMDKSPFHGNSIMVTYILLLGSLAIELISLIMYLASDWQITKMKQKKVDRSRASYAYEKLLRFINRLSHLTIRCSSSYCILPFFSRWSRGISQYNFLLYNLHRSSNDAAYSINATEDPIYRLFQVRIIGRDTRKIIFDELTSRSQLAKQPDDVEFWTTRAESILNVLSPMCADSSFSQWITDVEYEESLVIWHIATEICYYSDIKQDRDANFISFSQSISRYLLDLLNHQRVLLPASATTIGRMCLMDTSADARRFFDRTLPKSDRPENRDKLLEQACKRMMEVNTEIPPREIKGDDCKSVLFDGCRLAKALNKLEDMKIDKWRVMSKVWAEFLFFTAVQSSPEEHVKRLSRGGELLTLVWMLMAHLGIGMHFSSSNASETHSELVIG